MIVLLIRYHNFSKYVTQVSGNIGSRVQILTQAEYDILVDTGTVDNNTYYLIDDGN